MGGPQGHGGTEPVVRKMKKKKKKKEEKHLYKDVIFVLHRNYSCMSAIKLHTTAQRPHRDGVGGMGGWGIWGY